MAAVREGDTSLWLHNKLGTSNDTWVSGSICSQLNADVLRNIKECFVDLQAQVKLKLLLSFFHIPRKNLDEWKTELEEILEVAQVDSDPWVAMIAEIMAPFPTSGTLASNVQESEENSRIFHELLSDIRKIVREKSSGTNLIPKEAKFLNKNVVISLFGAPPQPVRHFQLKRKPKAAALRVELLSKATEVANNLKKHVVPTVPVRSRAMPRKMNDTTPLKGIPSVGRSGFRSSSLSAFGSSLSSRSITRPLAGHKEGGIKLLDINEQPIGYGLGGKKRKRPLESEEKKPPSTESLPVPTTPDYASGLTPSNPPTPAQPPPSGFLSPATPLSTHVSTHPSTPSTPAPVTGGLKTPSHVETSSTYLPDVSPSSTPNTTPQLPVSHLHVEQSQQQQQQVPGIPQQTEQARSTFASPQSLLSGNTGSSHPNAQMVLGTTPQHQQPQTQEQSQSPSQPQSQEQQQNQQPVYAVMRPVQPTYVQQSPPVQAVHVVRLSTTPQQPYQQPAQPQPLQQQPQQLQTPKKGLSLTREQMLEAQEMFRTANRVTRPEKALILGFMAGSRDNPCPHLGNIVTIKLSEDQETVQQGDGVVIPMIVETHFQMNYNTGEWKRIKKFRRLESQIAM
ncbi:unnamed protein product [Darwinula stevensoni]|uniref:HDAg domain-containing protein n=1 Tax=Darwinula stevensoni TaxID=69355 RepID=A0A7R9A6A0_9CRUS|nr:unnamed protein product [Darwinula stevensoni]CAG0888515.1 unnamed protein product [Darwinula stevensoni]